MKTITTTIEINSDLTATLEMDDREHEFAIRLHSKYSDATILIDSNELPELEQFFHKAQTF